ncbi:hypothetical protein [Tunturiibacter gelidoferens]|uniref:Uncharacterized protein n=1 Tax=Tunturiibacter gelidiferens TaxID=3069689 RepID=A0ACC5P3L3_9BACT|nr:hypothetical protein [Edaphobacter lichenicola]MBB5341449.1 hypothetical protein [Edaphobacter lichenicola]
MVTLQYRSITALDTIIDDATNACGSGPVHNLILAYEFSPDLVHSQFVKLYEEKAREWQKNPAPPNLFFSHGEYFHGEAGIQYVLKELKAKSSGRRALLSLANMDTFMGSGDRAVPSFLIAQFAIESDVLYVTEYFRAIEVGGFLPINVTEAALLIRRIIEEVRRPLLVRLVMLAFQAHLTPTFHCLERASVDMLKGGEIGVSVAQGKTAQLIEWLEGKKVFESEIDTRGLEEVLAAVKSSGDQYSPGFRSKLDQLLIALVEIKKMRNSSSLESTITIHREKYVELVDSAIAELRRKLSGT